MRTDKRKRPESHRVGDVGQTAVALCFKRWGWTADFITSDYGEDLDCTIFSEGRRTSFYFRCQVKSSVDTNLKVRKLSSGVYSISIDTDTCKDWLLSFFPVILALYDDKSGVIHWVEVASQIRSNLGILSKKTLTLHVPPNSLETSQTEIQNEISIFYSRLLRLESPRLQCLVFPVMMPGHRALPMRQLFEMWKDDASRSFMLEIGGRVIDDLPSWATAIRVMDGPRLRGWTVSSTNQNLDLFLSSLPELLATAEYSVGANRWISWVSDPVRFSTGNDPGSGGAFWNKELTDWWSYSNINGQIVSDFEYAFRIPTGFIRQISRRTQSWDGKWHVNPELDIAIQLLANAPTLPSYRLNAEAQRTNAKGHFIPWTCRKEEVERLCSLLASTELAFRMIEQEDCRPPDGCVYGAIAHQWFDPTIGLIPQPSDWDEFIDGSVRVQLEKNGLWTKLPGEEGPPEVSDLVMSFFGEGFGRPPSNLIVSEFEFTPGLPLDHLNRLIWVQRFRRVDKSIAETIEKKFDIAKQELEYKLKNVLNLEITWQLIEGWFGSIAEISVSWIPSLYLSSSNSYNKHSKVLLQFFDSLLPLMSKDDRDLRQTLTILRHEGQLYFEGDDPWGKAKRNK